jgi:hypothetical protein
MKIQKIIFNLLTILKDKSLFLEGQIIYFEPFYFKNGNTAKNKYFIVLKNINNKIIIASLPTRTSKAPSLINVNHGCINDEERCFNCYLFEKGRSITDNNFSFDLNTYVYGNEVEDYEIEILSSIYAIENIDYTIVGKLIEKEYQELYKCLVNSSSIRRGIKKLL